MKGSRKTLLIILALVLLVCLPVVVWFLLRPDERDAASVGSTSQGPSFTVSVEKPRMDRFLGGILPTRLEEKLIGGGELRFDQASRGARIGNAARDRLDLGADGWDLLIQTDSQGRVAPGTRLVFPIEIADKQWTLRCRPAEQAVGYLQISTRPGSGVLASDILDGRFLIELAKCEDAQTGQILDTEAGGSPGQAWPSSPLTLRGSFAGLQHRRP